MRAIEFDATEPGDWAFHCHKSHHTMNAMGHDVPTMIGVDHRDVAKKIIGLVPDYMVMGERGGADMGEMEMPIPDNTLPMMTGTGPFGAVEMGGMFTAVKVRKNLPADVFTDIWTEMKGKKPDWYQHPKGEIAYEWTGALPEPERNGATAGATVKGGMTVVKPRGGHSGH